MQTRRHLGFGRRAFTLVELLTVMTIIGILAALVLGTFKMVQDKAARNRAETEVKAMEAALESYKADNGEFPRDTLTDALNARTKLSPADVAYKSSILILYRALSGDNNLDRVVDKEDGKLNILGNPLSPTPTDPAPPKIYYQPSPSSLSPMGSAAVTAIIDPWGNCYGYSTANQANTTNGYNPTFDLWSTGGSTNDIVKWVKNW